MSLEYGFVFAKEDCIQCRGCETACKSWRNGVLGVRWRRVHALWSGKYPNVKMASASVSCMHCADPVCVKSCPEKAITKRPEDGIVVVDQSKCIGCETCLKECPYGAPQFSKDAKMQKCDLCYQVVDLSKDLPPCAAFCPTKALTVKKLETADKTAAEAAMKKLLAG